MSQKVKTISNFWQHVCMEKKIIMMRWMISGRAASGASAAGGPRTVVIYIKARLRQGGIVTAKV